MRILIFQLIIVLCECFLLDEYNTEVTHRVIHELSVVMNIIVWVQGKFLVDGVQIWHKFTSCLRTLRAYEPSRCDSPNRLGGRPIDLILIHSKLIIQLRHAAYKR